jgi:hypothetical protein
MLLQIQSPHVPDEGPELVPDMHSQEASHHPQPDAPEQVAQSV